MKFTFILYLLCLRIKVFSNRNNRNNLFYNNYKTRKNYQKFQAEKKSNSEVSESDDIQLYDNILVLKNNRLSCPALSNKSLSKPNNERNIHISLSGDNLEKVNITKKNNEIYDRILTKINSEMQPMEIPSFYFREEEEAEKVNITKKNNEILTNPKSKPMDFREEEEAEKVNITKKNNEILTNPKSKPMDFREEEEAEKVNITKKNNEIYDRILTKINSEMQPMDFLDEEGIEGIAIAEVPSFDFREEAGTNKTKNFHLSYSVKDPTNLNARPPRPGTGLSIGIFIGKICIFLFILSPIFWKTIKSIIKKF